MQALWTAGNQSVSLLFYGQEGFWSIRQKISGKNWIIGDPAFETDGQLMPSILDVVRLSTLPKLLHNGTTEYRVSGQIQVKIK